MNPRTVATIALLIGTPYSLLAQGVVITGGTPSAVVDALKGQLQPQGFQLVRADEKSALFSLDRGMVPQQGSRAVQGALVHVVLEFTARFKQKDQGLQVTASEEVVGNPRSSTQFRKPVESPLERQNMQRLLDAVRAEIQSRQSARDSATKRDSIPQ